ncbi:AAA family ATPase [Erythrobacter crassostreae]|uniref:AAA family ATPase n=1 Tax=Erythrobacter crassostreae TaxID=2828328 RepID=A0A9X1JKI2_9SPHN|nr:AAA family ATPase [Erythrobacter crassostrea]
MRDLANVLRASLGDIDIVGIDGWTGVGKTTLAKNLAKEMGGSFYDLDCALTLNQNKYVSALQTSKISRALTERQRPLMIAGICLLEVLEIVGAHLDAHVYVKRMSSWGWADEDELTGQYFEVPGASGEAVRREMRAYHRKWQPHLLADIEYYRAG